MHFVDRNRAHDFPRTWVCLEAESHIAGRRVRSVDAPRIGRGRPPLAGFRWTVEPDHGHAKRGSEVHRRCIDRYCQARMLQHIAKLRQGHLAGEHETLPPRTLDLSRHNLDGHSRRNARAVIVAVVECIIAGARPGIDGSYFINTAEHVWNRFRAVVIVNRRKVSPRLVSYVGRGRRSKLPPPLLMPPALCRIFASTQMSSDRIGGLRVTLRRRVYVSCSKPTKLRSKSDANKSVMRTIEAYGINPRRGKQLDCGTDGDGIHA